LDIVKGFDKDIAAHGGGLHGGNCVNHIHKQKGSAIRE